MGIATAVCSFVDAPRNFSCIAFASQLDDGWPESEKDVFQAALSMVVVKNSR